MDNKADKKINTVGEKKLNQRRYSVKLIPRRRDETLIIQEVMPGCEQRLRRRTPESQQ